MRPGLTELLHRLAGRRRWATGLCLLSALLVAGCTGAGASSSQVAPAGNSAPPSGTAHTRPPAAHHHHHHHHRRHHPRPPAGSRGLAYSTLSAAVVEPQPAAGSCHERGGGLDALPDRTCTPGALNPRVTQATIGQTICSDGWTSTVRPAEAITEPEKWASMAAYGLDGSSGAYEYDHLVPLELGGARNDPRNLWPEPDYSDPSPYILNPKDRLEDELNRQVCDGQLPLATAQAEIATDWVAVYEREFGAITASGGSTGSGGSGGSATCTVTASHNATYDDWDVYVHSNQPDATATVTDASGTSASWRTDGGGYADVYLHASASAAGERVTVRVGSAVCTTTL